LSETSQLLGQVLRHAAHAHPADAERLAAVQKSLAARLSANFARELAGDGGSGPPATAPAELAPFPYEREAARVNAWFSR
jgi:hypothetical protein